jgi:hypothetical protein
MKKSLNPHKNGIKSFFLLLRLETLFKTSFKLSQVISSRVSPSLRKLEIALLFCDDVVEDPKIGLHVDVH